MKFFLLNQTQSFVEKELNENKKIEDKLAVSNKFGM
jgi:hypothetical protein